MMDSSVCALFLAVLLPLAAGCGRGWEVDSGKPAAQFVEDVLPENGGTFVGKKITVKGIVTRVDLTDARHCRVYLGHGICCDLGKLKAMAAGCAVGSTVYIDGILKRCEEGNILLAPAIRRDLKAPFTPVQETESPGR